MLQECLLVPQGVVQALAPQLQRVRRPGSRVARVRLKGRALADHTLSAGVGPAAGGPAGQQQGSVAAWGGARAHRKREQHEAQAQAQARAQARAVNSTAVGGPSARTACQDPPPAAHHGAEPGAPAACHSLRFASSLRRWLTRLTTWT